MLQTVATGTRADNVFSVVTLLNNVGRCAASISVYTAQIMLPLRMASSPSPRPELLHQPEALNSG
jgi:hypothetical protein